jgi:hypothetical protein
MQLVVITTAEAAACVEDLLEDLEVTFPRISTVIVADGTCKQHARGSAGCTK